MQRIVETVSNSAFFNLLFGDSVFIEPYLRFVGLRLGRGAARSGAVRPVRPLAPAAQRRASVVVSAASSAAGARAARRTRAAAAAIGQWGRGTEAVNAPLAAAALGQAPLRPAVCASGGTRTASSTS